MPVARYFFVGGVLLARCFSAMKFYRNCRPRRRGRRRARAPTDWPSGSARIGNGPNAWFSIPTSRPSFPRRRQRYWSGLQPRPRSPTSRPSRVRCSHLPNSSRPNRRSRNRSRCTSAEYQKPTWRRRWSWSPSSRDLVFANNAWYRLPGRRGDPVQQVASEAQPPRQIFLI